MGILTSILPLWLWIVLFLILVIGIALVYALLKARQAKPEKIDWNQLNPTPISASGSIHRSVPMVSYSEVKAEYEQRLRAWRVAGYEIDSRFRAIQSLDYRAMDVAELLRHTPSPERSNIAAILGISANSEPEVVFDALRKAGSHGVASFVRGGDVVYDVVVRDVAEKLGAKNLPKMCNVADLEKLAVGAALEQMLAKVTPQDRAAMLEELSRNQTTSSTGIVTATGGLVLANLSGFGLYLAASSSLAAITGAVGLTLPFAAYTGLSSILATVTGPIGWTALAVFAVVKFGGAEYNKTVPGVIAIATSRAHLIASHEAEMAKLHKQRSLRNESGLRLEVLADFISSMERVGASQVPRASVPW